ncbi:VOC family protein [Leucobacter sp. NPDC077196]|uniref:VOC family protein n=1 Tax=Leucobacter sp. NPDC077196 TaxID=3154959 RepID=UPI0034268A9C
MTGNARSARVVLLSVPRIDSSPRSRRPILVAVAIGALLSAAGGITWFAISQSASAGGDAAPAAALPDGTSMGAVELHVHELPAVRDYYADAVGLRVLEESEAGAVLGFDEPLIRLTVNEEGEDGSTLAEPGLYHSAILYPDRQALAAAILNLANTAPHTFQGSADHAVSEAFYFLDPEGNGLELYADRPASEWVWERGEVQLGSAELDPNAFIAEHLGDGAAADGATVGHVHLKVGDLEQAEEFYAGALGFAVTARADGALFYAADGYHHHVATNTWQSEGAESRTNATGLAGFTVAVPGAGAIDDIETRLADGGYTSERSESGITAWDPWGNAVRLVVPG